MTKPLIILDPGHGGIDSGALLKDAAGKILATERDLNLDLALTLKAELCAAGFDVVLTRTTAALPGGVSSPPASFYYRCQTQPVQAFASLSIHHDVQEAKGGGVYFDGNDNWLNYSSKGLAQQIAAAIHGWCRPDTDARQGSLAMCRQPHTLRRVLVELGPVRLYTGPADRIKTVQPVADVLKKLAQGLKLMP